MLISAAILAAGSGAGIKWTSPANWKTEGDRPMRLATYTIPATAGDHETGLCIVSYFGAGQGGSVQANLDRWISQFLQADGKASKGAGKVDHRTIHGLKVTVVDVSGAYTGMGGPGGPQGAPKQGYRLLGSIIEGPQGEVFFKFTGPAKTVAQNQAAFDKMMGTLSPQ